MFEVIDLHFSYPGREALFKGLSLRFPEQGGICLAGENGCGKSTLLKLLCARLKADKGEIKCKERAIFYLPQEPQGRILGLNLMQDLSIWQMAGLKPDPVKKHPLMEGFDPDTWNMPIRELSKGTVQAYLNSLMLSLPEYYPVLDEPFTALDSHRADILREALSKRDGYILVSHDSSDWGEGKTLNLSEGWLS